MIDTIAAIATARGPAAISVARLSGPQALEVVRRLAPGLPEELAPRTATLAEVADPDSGEPIDQVLVTWFPGPASYTGEEVVELSGHGGWLAPAFLEEALARAGARAAEPGEFTRRAYLNGKMDLVQAEAVVDLIEGRSRALHRAALHQLERGLSERLGRLRHGLVEIEAMLVHHLDFPEEDEAPFPAERIAVRARELLAELEGTLATAPEGELLREGALVVLAGRPNSGKSSLFNALAGYDRAIVTDIPGTTRDALEVSVSISGFPFRLVDTAGFRDDPEEVERLGIEVARRYLERADGIIFCVDGTRPSSPEEEAFREGVEVPTVVARTKSDLGSAGPPAGDEITVSVVTGEGLDTLGRRLGELAFGGLITLDPDVPVVTHERQRRQLQIAVDEVRAFAAGLESGLPAEVAATHLRPAETALEELLGVIASEEVLDHLFARFCIGK